jgi:hypothetical protein
MAKEEIPTIKQRMSDTDRLLQLSLLLKAIDDLDQGLAQFRAEYKAQRETLQGELSKLRWEVLSGQERLPLAGD